MKTKEALKIFHELIIHAEEIENLKDPFGFTKAINWDKLEDPKVLKELEKIFDEDEKDENDS